MNHGANRLDKSMGKIYKKLKKLIEVRESTENDLYKCYDLLLDYNQNQSRSTKIETVVEKVKF